MITETPAAKVTGFVHRNITDSVRRVLQDAGIIEYYLVPSRSVMLKKRKAPFGLILEHRTVDDPADRVICFVPPEWGRSVANLIIRGGDLSKPGRGSVMVENVTISRAHDLCDPTNNTCMTEESFPDGPARLRDGLTGICCITQRGEGDNVARIALETGACVPLVTFGQGTGVRDKLGLLRITIPAEKEIAIFAATTYDADEIMDMIIEIAKLDQPGKGFIYLFPLEGGLINMKVFRGTHQHAASIEQIVAAIDEIKGDSRWRAIAHQPDQIGRPAKTYLRGLKSLSYICNEGRGEELVLAAMEAGAPGATVNHMHYAGRRGFGEQGISPAREMISMIVHPSQVDSITDAMTGKGALDDETHGLFFISPVPKAYTYI
ncbi:MAG: hypothetical protein PHU03_04910 [Syntrophales bacterium]|nr:hypothetical protein [Syntrophales bacterium]